MQSQNSSTPMPSAMRAALEALSKGWQATPVRSTKAPYLPSWNKTKWNTPDELTEAFTKAHEDDANNVGLILGEPSNGLVDVDLDNSMAVALAPAFLPPTPMVVGRENSPRSHYWYRVDGELPRTTQWRGADNSSMIVELRSTGGQSIVPPSIHPTGEHYVWEGEPWGGDAGPLTVGADELALQVAGLAMTTVLAARWPDEGSRHDAYLCLAGALLRHGDAVHPWWTKTLPSIIKAIAWVTGDTDGKHKRVAEVMGTTRERIGTGGLVKGWPSLAELIGDDVAFRARDIATKIDEMLGVDPPELRPQAVASDAYLTTPEPTEREHPDHRLSHAIGEPTEPYVSLSGGDPMLDRVDSWDMVDLTPYLEGKAVKIVPGVLQREDGQYLLYPGKVNSLFGSSESAKSWLALHTCRQLMTERKRALFLDLEDEPTQCVERLLRIGTDVQDIQDYFRYIRPEGPLADMSRGGRAMETAQFSSSLFGEIMQAWDPHLIIVDGLTQLYAYHDLDPSNALDTATISNWFAAITRHSRTSVLVLDHEAKDGNTQFGSQHKKAMVSGASLRAEVVEQPRPGALGQVQLQVAKDRHGGVREHASQGGTVQVAGTFTLDSRTDGVTTVTVEPPPAHIVEIDVTGTDVARADKKAAHYDDYEHIYSLLPGFDATAGVSTKEISDVTGLSEHRVRACWKYLEEQNRIAVQGSTKSRRYRKAE